MYIGLCVALTLLIIMVIIIIIVIKRKNRHQHDGPHHLQNGGMNQTVFTQFNQNYIGLCVALTLLIIMVIIIIIVIKRKNRHQHDGPHHLQNGGMNQTIFTQFKRQGFFALKTIPARQV